MKGYSEEAFLSLSSYCLFLSVLAMYAVSGPTDLLNTEKIHITKTCPCNIQQFFTSVKTKNFK